jgi:hypothetical protein
MKISIKESFISVFQETEWFNKFILGVLLISANPLIDTIYREFIVNTQKSQTEMLYTKSGFTIIAITLTLKAFFGLTYLILMGYIIKYVHNKINDIKPTLPKWSNYMKQGFCYLSISALYGLILITPLIMQHPMGLVNILGFCVLLLMLTPFVFFSTILYSKDFKFNDAFDFKNILLIIKRTLKHSYLCTFLVLPLACWPFSYEIIKVIPINIIIKLPFVFAFGFVEFWLSFVSINIFVQIYKLSEYRKLKHEESSELIQSSEL